MWPSIAENDTGTDLRPSHSVMFSETGDEVRKQEQFMSQEQWVEALAAGKLLVVCCFCVEPVDPAVMVTLVVTVSNVEGVQDLRCHHACLSDRVHRSVPLLPPYED